MIKRALALNHRKHIYIGDSYKTVHIEQIPVTAGLTDFRQITNAPANSILLDPKPIIRGLGSENVIENGAKVDIGDYEIEIIGDQLDETTLRQMNQIVLNKGQADEEKMQILHIRPTKILGNRAGNDQIYVIGGKVVVWSIYARSTKHGL